MLSVSAYRFGLLTHRFENADKAQQHVAALERKAPAEKIRYVWVPTQAQSPLIQDDPSDSVWLLESSEPGDFELDTAIQLMREIFALQQHGNTPQLAQARQNFTAFIRQFLVKGQS